MPIDTSGGMAMRGCVETERVNAGKAAIFDLDGTVLDSMGVWERVDEVCLGRRGIAVPKDYAQAVAHMQFRQIAEYTIDRFSLDDTPDGLMDEWRSLARESYTTVVRAKPHALEYLTHLRHTGAKLAVATTLPRELRGPALAHAGLAGLFDAVCGTDDVGFVAKEHPDVYLHAAHAVAVEPRRCTVFEDMLVGIVSAKGAGMGAWAVRDASSAHQWERLRDAADGVLDDFSTAPRVL